ncbi:Regulator of G-protein signaling 12 [Liparis tanakae]|uniref:Regulator of G-protein signaling 12 n=1 Tax=Liparis tanakae TaxID=230148 RepID=A0A4Z2EQH5_9TELE|nr:Regulator of G-protein signaling 12 [Liparis tanakae]
MLCLRSGEGPERVVMDAGAWIPLRTRYLPRFHHTGSYQLYPELNSVELQGCSSDNSLNSNASLPSVQSHRRHTERRVASWAACFERLLQDPVGVRYFSEFLKKEFSEENILFWQACEFFSHVPENDKKQLSQRAREIYNSFLSSKATTPVNIDSQAQLADDILNAPRPDMFKEQQQQVTEPSSGGK